MNYQINQLLNNPIDPASSPEDPELLFTAEELQDAEACIQATIDHQLAKMGYMGGM